MAHSETLDVLRVREPSSPVQKGAAGKAAISSIIAFNRASKIKNMLRAAAVREEVENESESENGGGAAAEV